MFVLRTKSYISRNLEHDIKKMEEYIRLAIETTLPGINSTNIKKYLLAGAEITQEQLVEGIYEAPENLSRVEHGKAMPTKKKFEGLMGKLGIEQIGVETTYEKLKLLLEDSLLLKNGKIYRVPFYNELLALNMICSSLKKMEKWEEANLIYEEIIK